MFSVHLFSSMEQHAFHTASDVFTWVVSSQSVKTQLNNRGSTDDVPWSVGCYDR